MTIDIIAMSSLKVNMINKIQSQNKSNYKKSEIGKIFNKIIKGISQF